MRRIFRHLRLGIAGFHLQLNFPSQSAHAIEFVDGISCAGNDGPSHHHKCDSHHSNFLLNDVAGHRKPGPKLHGTRFIHSQWGLGHARTLHPTPHSAPCGAISAQEQRQQQQSQEPTALQLHGSLSHEKQHELTQVPSLNEVSCSGWKMKLDDLETKPHTSRLE